MESLIEFPMELSSEDLLPMECPMESLIEFKELPMPLPRLLPMGFPEE